MGKLIILSGPSCAGKNTVFEYLDAKGYGRVITTTTRGMRTNEKDGVDYYFITRELFEKRLEDGEFIEHNEYDGNLYGVSCGELEKVLSEDRAVFAIVDVNGAKAIKSRYPDAVCIFLLPPSFEELRRRMVKRGENTPEEIERRLEIARNEVFEGVVLSDLLFVNHDAEDTADEIVRRLYGFI